MSAGTGLAGLGPVPHAPEGEDEDTSSMVVQPPPVQAVGIEALAPPRVGFRLEARLMPRRLTQAEIQRVVRAFESPKTKVHRDAVYNFLGSAPLNIELVYHLMNLRSDARSYGWNAPTEAAIKHGLEKMYNDPLPEVPIIEPPRPLVPGEKWDLVLGKFLVPGELGGGSTLSVATPDDLKDTCMACSKPFVEGDLIAKDLVHVHFRCP